MKTANLAGIKVGRRYPVRLMGVINVSPESFYKGSVWTRISSLARIAREMEKDGADLIDVGAMSTAPYLKTAISEREEARRLARAVRSIRGHVSIPISVDTSRALPAWESFKAGAQILNDVHGLAADPRLGAAAKRAAGFVLMAYPHRPRTVRDPIRYTRAEFRAVLKRAQRAGLPSDRIVLDPGIGFFREMGIPWWKWDLSILERLDRLTNRSRPLLVGISRKSFIGRLMNGAPPDDRLSGSIAATALAVLKGASMVRTHDIRETRRALNVVRALRPPPLSSS